MAGLLPQLVRANTDPEVATLRGDTGGPGFLFYSQTTDEENMLAAELPKPFRFKNIPCGNTIAWFIIDSILEYDSSVDTVWFWLRTNVEPDRENFAVGEFYPERQLLQPTPGTDRQITHTTIFPVVVDRFEPVEIQVAPLNEGHSGFNVTKCTVNVKVVMAQIQRWDLTGVDPRIIDTIRPRLEYPMVLEKEEEGETDG